MPLGFGHKHHHHHHNHKSSSNHPDSPQYTAEPTPISTSRRGSIAIEEPSETSLDRRTSTISSTSSGPPPSILKKTSTTNSTDGSSLTGSSSSASAFLSKRLSGIGLDRTETISSTFSEEEPSTPSTPATSVSSLGGGCPLPPDESTGYKFPFTMVTLSGVSTLSFIALPTKMRPGILTAIHQAWPKGIKKSGQVDYMPELMKKHQEKGCHDGVWEVTMRDNAWMPDSKDKVASKRIMINLMMEFARNGYILTSSFRTSAKDSGKDTLIFTLAEPDPDPIFFAVAFHSSDRVWIIDAEADVGEALEKGIREWWLDGIRDARVRERHCREIRLRGNPWTAHAHSSLVSARCIHLAIMKHITHCNRGYDYVGSVQMADSEEGEMAVTFYRKKWGMDLVI